MARKHRKNSKPNPKAPSRYGPAEGDRNVLVTHKYVFQSATNNPVNISVGDLLQTMGVMATGVNTVNTIFKAVRLRYIKIWTNAVTTGIGLSNAVEWLSSDSGVMTKQFSSSTNNISHPAYLYTKPPSSTAAWFWRSITNIGGGANTDLFNILAPTGSFIEVGLQGLMSDVAFANWSTTTVTAATVSEIYYGGLDGIGAGTGLFVPVGLTTIT